MGNDFILSEKELRQRQENCAQNNILTQQSPQQIKQRTALNVQVGGDHYKRLKIQPVEYNHANNLGFCEGSVVKYITRWREKGGLADLEKAKHFIDLLIDLENKQLSNQVQSSAKDAKQNSIYGSGSSVDISS